MPFGLGSAAVTHQGFADMPFGAAYPDHMGYLCHLGTVLGRTAGLIISSHGCSFVRGQILVCGQCKVSGEGLIKPLSHKLILYANNYKKATISGMPAISNSYHHTIHTNFSNKHSLKSLMQAKSIRDYIGKWPFRNKTIATDNFTLSGIMHKTIKSIKMSLYKLDVFFPRIGYFSY